MWNRDTFAAVCDPPVIGMVHLGPLPGSPAAAPIADVVGWAVADAGALAEGGLTAVMIENFHDVPFYPDRVPPVTVAAMAMIVAGIQRRQRSLTVGINVLRNDAEAALGIAAVTGAAYIRVNFHAGAAVTDLGLIQGEAHRTLRLRRDLGLDDEASGGAGVGILADLRVKHARSLGQRPLADSARDLRLRGLADAIIVSGEATGAPTDLQELATVREALPDCPLIVGSGVCPENITDYAPLADGFIVGTALQENDDGRRRVSVAQTGRLIAALRAARTDQRSGR
jgi:membrane complex biogenesis BtpA family protein